MEPTRADLEHLHCWFTVDAVRGDPEATAFKRRARYHQALWRESENLPMGWHVSGKARVVRPNGSRIEPGAAVASGANFLTANARDQAAQAGEAARRDPLMTLDRDRLSQDLLSSMPMCFNLFSELAADDDRLLGAAGALWPDHPGTPDALRLEWSPGRRDPRFLDDRTAFDAAITTVDDGGRPAGIIGIETKYHEHAVAERAPDRAKRPRYWEVTEASGLFTSGWERAVLGTDLQQIWRDHLLVLAMLQSDEGWSWGRYVLVHPAKNPSFARAAERYRGVLEDDSTFEVRTIEDLLDEHVLHPADVEVQFRRRYLWDD